MNKVRHMLWFGAFYKGWRYALGAFPLRTTRTQ